MIKIKNKNQDGRQGRGKITTARARNGKGLKPTTITIKAKEDELAEKQRRKPLFLPGLDGILKGSGGGD